MSSSRLSSGLLALLAAVTSPCALAAEWVAEPSVSLRGEYNDNIRLTTAEHDAVWGLILHPKLALSRRTELWDLSATGRVRGAAYEGQDGLNTVDNFLDIAAKRQLERGSLEASAGLAYDTTLQTEFLDLDTGLVVNQIDRTRKELRVAGSYILTEATWVEGALGYSTIEYDGGEIYGLLDYDYLTPSLTLIHQLDARVKVFTVLSHSRVDYERADQLESKTDSMQIGGSYDLSERWKLNGSIGARRTSTSNVVPVERPGFEIFYPFIYDLADRESETTGLVYNAALSRSFETGNISLNATRSITPSSTGTDTDTTSVSINADRRFNAKLSGRLAVSYFQSESVGNTRTLADRERYRVEPSLSWSLDRDLRLSTGYSYTHVSRGSAGAGTADNNAVFVSLGYYWPRMAVSR